MPHFEHGDVSAEVDGVAAGVCRVHGRTFTDSHRKEEDFISPAVLRLVKNLHEVKELLNVSRGRIVDMKGKSDMFVHP